MQRSRHPTPSSNAATPTNHRRQTPRSVRHRRSYTIGASCYSVSASHPPVLLALRTTDTSTPTSSATLALSSEQASLCPLPGQLEPCEEAVSLPSAVAASPVARQCGFFETSGTAFVRLALVQITRWIDQGGYVPSALTAYHRVFLVAGCINVRLFVSASGLGNHHHHLNNPPESSLIHFWWLDHLLTCLT